VDGGDQLGQLQLVQYGEHAGLGVGQPPLILHPVREHELHPFQRTAAVIEHPSRIS
jgi:hypothetical protein